jgi:hypothetical protein
MSNYAEWLPDAVHIFFKKSKQIEQNIKHVPEKHAQKHTRCVLKTTPIPCKSAQRKSGGGYPENPGMDLSLDSPHTVESGHEIVGKCSHRLI